MTRPLGSRARAPSNSAVAWWAGKMRTLVRRSSADAPRGPRDAHALPRGRHRASHTCRAKRHIRWHRSRAPSSMSRFLIPPSAGCGYLPRRTYSPTFPNTVPASLQQNTHGPAPALAHRDRSQKCRPDRRRRPAGKVNPAIVHQRASCPSRTVPHLPSFAGSKHLTDSPQRAAGASSATREQRPQRCLPSRSSRAGTPINAVTIPMALLRRPLVGASVSATVSSVPRRLPRRPERAMCATRQAYGMGP